MKLNEIKKAEQNIQSFCNKLGTIITITNSKGLWTARMTRKAVQIFLVTGESQIEAYIKAGETCENKIKSLGV